jgi:hypothetical protein
LDYWKKLFWTAIADMIHVQTLRHGLKFTVTIGHTHCTNVVALREEQFQDHLAVLKQAVTLGGHFHAFFGLGHTGGNQTIGASDFDHT